MDKFLKINLQLFADSGTDGDQKKDDQQGKKDDDKKTYTQEELKAMLQAETDKRVTEALKTSQAKWEKEFKATLEKEKTEAERMAKLNEDEKRAEIFRKKDEELARKQSEIEFRELKLETINMLNEKSLPIEFAEVLIGKDAESTKKGIEIFEKSFQKAVEKAVDEKLKSNPPGGSSGSKDNLNNPWSKDHYNLTEQGKIIKENPELAKKLKASAAIK